MKNKAILGSALAMGFLLIQAIPATAFAYGEGVPVFFAPTGISGQSGQITPSSGGGSSQGEVLGASAYNFTKQLHYGATGQDVDALQQILITLGFLKITTPTGWYGPLTFAAVKEYQASKGIEQVGVVGPKTLLALNQGIVPTVPEQPAVLRWIESTGVGKAVQQALSWSAST